MDTQSKSSSIKAERTDIKSSMDDFFKTLHDHAYSETIVVMVIYFIVGYFIDSEDICLVNGEVSYILIVLAIITLFHGFENGILAVGMTALVMWAFYDVLPYLHFLIILMMTMINGEFHFYWTKRIDKAEIDSNYKANKLDELSKAFYSLKISHDQLEKNYVVKPMSIRNSIEEILEMNLDVDNSLSDRDKNHAFYSNFLGLLEKSFNVNSALIIYKTEHNKDTMFSPYSSHLVLGSYTEELDLEFIFEDYLVDKALAHGIPIYVSDELGDPNANLDTDSDYIATIPSVIDGEMVAILAIKRMPFMSFNREILTSVSILLEYFSIEIGKNNLLAKSDTLPIIPDKEFRFEYERLRYLFLEFKVDSIILVLRIDNELQFARVYEIIKKMLRSLDRVTIVEENDFYYIVLLFPLHDKAAAEGYLNRLIGLLTYKEKTRAKDALQRDEKTPEEIDIAMKKLKIKDINFESMTFDMTQNSLLNKYLREDYGR